MGPKNRCGNTHKNKTHTRAMVSPPSFLFSLSLSSLALSLSTTTTQITQHNSHETCLKKTHIYFPFVVIAPTKTSVRDDVLESSVRHLEHSRAMCRLGHWYRRERERERESRRQSKQLCHLTTKFNYALKSPQEKCVRSHVCFFS
jgi:hypothetical protein